jgi:hypothetical protein
MDPGRTIRQETRRIRGFPKISWKQYSGDWIYPVPPGTKRNLSKPAAGYGHRISGIFWLETVSFLGVFAGNSRNTASGIIVLGSSKMIAQ